jgi:hypothetical protein
MSRARRADESFQEYREHLSAENRQDDRNTAGRLFFESRSLPFVLDKKGHPNNGKKVTRCRQYVKGMTPAEIKARQKAQIAAAGKEVVSAMKDLVGIK